jgi:hypothetical protein
LVPETLRHFGDIFKGRNDLFWGKISNLEDETPTWSRNVGVKNPSDAMSYPSRQDTSSTAKCVAVVNELNERINNEMVLTK